MKPAQHSTVGLDLIKDFSLIVVSVLVSILLVKTGVISQLLSLAGGAYFLHSLVAGFFFTSAFTTPPAIAVLGEVSRASSIISTAFFGAIGAVGGDLLIFRFMRDRFSKHLTHLVGVRGILRRLHALLKLRFFHWLTFLVGGIIIASPLPDELGLSLLGFSKVRTSWFIALSFFFNFIGIVVIGLAARAL